MMNNVTYITGASGSGKSFLAKTLINEFPLDSLTIIIDFWGEYLNLKDFLNIKLSKERNDSYISIKEIFHLRYNTVFDLSKLKSSELIVVLSEILLNIINRELDYKINLIFEGSGILNNSDYLKDMITLTINQSNNLKLYFIEQRLPIILMNKVNNFLIGRVINPFEIEKLQRFTNLNIDDIDYLNNHKYKFLNIQNIESEQRND